MGMTPAQAKQLGEIISRARSRKGLSIRQLAQQLGISFSWLSKLEAGVYADPKMNSLAQLSQALDIPASQIDRVSKGALSGGLPEPRVYFRAKLDLSDEQAARVEGYIEKLRRAA